MEKNSPLSEIGKDEYMKSKTYRRKACEGSIYITVARTGDGKLSSLLITPPSKSNDCGGSYAYALQDLTTFALRRAEGEQDIKLIIKALSGQYCNAMPPNKDKCKSCPDCVASVLREELK